MKKSKRIFVVGTSGSGKSYFVLWYVEDLILKNPDFHFVLCDYTGEYENLKRLEGVTSVLISEQNKKKIDWVGTLQEYPRCVVEVSPLLTIPEINHEFATIANACMRIGNITYILDEAPNLIPTVSPFKQDWQINSIRRLAAQVERRAFTRRRSLEIWSPAKRKRKFCLGSAFYTPFIADRHSRFCSCEWFFKLHDFK